MMLHSMLAGLFDNGYDWNKVVGNLPLGLMAAGLGLLSVFVILGVLILFVTVFHKIMEGRKSKQTLPVLPPAVCADTEEDARVAAAVTAAITAYYEQEQAETGEEIQFIIRKIKRTR